MIGYGLEELVGAARFPGYRPEHGDCPALDAPQQKRHSVTDDEPGRSRLCNHCGIELPVEHGLTRTTARKRALRDVVSSD